MMIRSFRDDATRRLFERDPSAPFPPELRDLALRRLAILHSAVRLADLKALPELHIETLRGGSHKGYHRIRLDSRSSLYFWWMDGDAYKTEIITEP